MDQPWTPRRQGDAGELSAMDWLTRAGACVSRPVFEHADYDFIADFGGTLVRVQVKTSSSWHRRRWYVALCTRGGNQSWSGLVKLLDTTRCDSLFVHVADGRRWYIPSAAVGGGSRIVLGGPKYAAFEIDSAGPLPVRLEPPAEPISPAAQR
jgi:hypothetical protein